MTENIPAFTENTGPVNVLGRDKREVDFFVCFFQSDYWLRLQMKLTASQCKSSCERKGHTLD